MPAALRAAQAKQVPVGRFSQPKEQTGQALLLLSDHASLVAFLFGFYLFWAKRERKRGLGETEDGRVRRRRRGSEEERGRERLGQTEIQSEGDWERRGLEKEQRETES